MQRVLVIGPCGAGKSTLAGALGPRLKLPVFHMDELNWKPGWIESSKDEITSNLHDIIATNRWLIDGTYGETLGPRLDFPISLCVRRLLKRIWTYRGRSRPDMTEGCAERFDVAFLLYLIRWNSGPRIHTEARLKGHENKIIRLRNPDELQRWMDTLPAVA